MKVWVRSFWASKAGNTREEYEDAFYPKGMGKFYGDLLRFAVADGASEGMLSGKWADILVKILHRVRSPNLDPEDFLQRSYSAWNAWKAAYLKHRELHNKPIQWFEEPGLQAGAFASFLVLTLLGSNEEPKIRWTAIALGDTCLFHMRDETLIKVFPIESSRDFNNRPLLVSSQPTRNSAATQNIKKTEGECISSDRFLLTTDALAHWFMRTYEAGRPPKQILPEPESLAQPSTFNRWLEGLRREHEIRNDDVTLIIIDII
ncbi:MAG: hypothetical protein O7B35_19940 [Deltaproteobacteria bacterium]|nr:hypothetical protein [Deltaproteobacteria bacterium]